MVPTEITMPSEVHNRIVNSYAICSKQDSMRDIYGSIRIEGTRFARWSRNQSTQNTRIAIFKNKISL